MFTLYIINGYFVGETYHEISREPMQLEQDDPSVGDVLGEIVLPRFSRYVPEEVAMMRIQLYLTSVEQGNPMERSRTLSSYGIPSGGAVYIGSYER